MTTSSPAPGTPQTPTKAVVSLAVSFLTALITAVVAGSPDTFREWVVIVGGAVVSFLATYYVPNTSTSSRA